MRAEGHDVTRVCTGGERSNQLFGCIDWLNFHGQISRAPAQFGAQRREVSGSKVGVARDNP